MGIPLERRGPQFSEHLLEKIGECSPDLIYAKDRAGRMIFANPAVLAAVGRTWAEVESLTDVDWHDDPEQARRFMETDARIMASDSVETLEEELTGPAGRKIYLSTKGPLKDAQGDVVGVFGISVDITARKAAEAHGQFLIEEMNHRVKNTLTIVQSMARQTLKVAGVDKAAWDAFEARLISMARAHDVLTRQDWIGADVVAIVADSTERHGQPAGGRFDIDGPSIIVDAQTALALAMALHELGTNAIKYGALSAPTGRVSVRWAVDEDARGRVLDFRWNESGGPQVTIPDHQGFGTRLIQQAFSQHDADSARVEYLPQGVEFRLRLVIASQITA